MSEVAAGLVAGKQITKAVSLLSPLSSGGMGAVWLADHHGLKTRVVVKFMLIGLDSSGSARTRFSREAAAAAQVKSPHVVQMLDHGLTDDGVPFIVMEHLEGHDLGDEIEKNGALDPAKVVAVITQVAKALSKVHAAGLLHRDIKPDNIFLCDGEDDTFAKLLDFGIAKSSGGDAGDGSLDGETKTGQIVGTPFYMSPEQVTAQKVIDHRSDLWALGIVAYEALTGIRPYDGPSFGALAVKIATAAPPKVTEANPNLPPAVDGWFAKACARDPAARFASAKEMGEAFRAAFEGVVSLPASAINSDSGQRGQLSSSSGARSAAAAGAAGAAGEGAVLSGSSGSRNHPNANNPQADTGSGRVASPTFGLAATALEDSASKQHVALGRSEAGVSVAEGGARPQRSSPFVFIAGAVLLSIVVVGAFLWSAKSNHANGNSTNASSGGSPSTASSSTQPTASLSASNPTIATNSAGGAPTTSSSTSAPVATAGRDAGSAAVTTTIHATTRPTGGHANASSGAPKPPPTDTPPKPTAKPTSSEPDLF